MELISVVIPVYNGAKTIRETIESILQQTYSHFEVIVINSDSTDRTLEIVSSIQDQRIKIHNYPKANVAINRNRGLTHAGGEFISFLDADDLWKPDKLELQYKALKENPQTGVAYSWTDAIDEQGKFFRPCSHAIWKGDVYAKLLLDDFIGSGSNAMIRSDTFVEVGNFDETLTNAEDTDMWLRLAARYHFIFVPKVQVFYRISANSKSSNISGLEVSNLKIIEKSFANADAALHYLKPYRVANLYKYLSYKALSVTPGKQNTIQATRILLQTVMTDITILGKPIIYKSFLKLLILTILTPSQATLLLNKFPQISNISTFFGYIKTH
ncbi:glycosyltransferase [Anabaena sp. PCC 7108]|uniref:glycosyltransferase n=1 Tax=Anabaena sp. PCC 7108 TaxID=163908 RepID=UPI000347FB96|nr:glycosyltransferase [Anabaena sp. PCC 7108]